MKLLQSKGVKKKWFVENKLKIPYSTFDWYIKNDSMPKKIIDIILKELECSYEDLTKE